MAAAGIGVVTLPHTNLWLGGHGQQPVPRGLTAVDALRGAGVAVAAGADNLQDRSTRWAEPAPSRLRR